MARMPLVSHNTKKKGPECPAYVDAVVDEALPQVIHKGLLRDLPQQDKVPETRLTQIHGAMLPSGGLLLGRAKKEVWAVWLERKTI